jgi:hypothetical protein
VASGGGRGVSDGGWGCRGEPGWACDGGGVAGWGWGGSAVARRWAMVAYNDWPTCGGGPALGQPESTVRWATGGGARGSRALSGGGTECRAAASGGRGMVEGSGCSAMTRVQNFFCVVWVGKQGHGEGLWLGYEFFKFIG